MSLGLVILVLGVFLYFCPAGDQNVHSQVLGFSKDTRDVWSRDYSFSFTETMNIEGYPYQFPGTLLMVCGFVLFAGALVYAPVLRRLKPVKAGQVKEE
jgi:drug/metabolite transporter (DMT)-like permease